MNADIRAKVETFVEDLTELIHESALAAVQQVLGGGGRTGGATRSAPASRKKKGRKKKGRKKAGRRAAGGGASSAQAQQLLAEIRSVPGRRFEELADELGTTTNDLRPALTQLLDAGQIRREGMARGTKYYAGGGGGRKKASKKKRGKKGRRKGGRKKARTTTTSSSAA